MYYFNNIYIYIEGRKKSNKRNVERMKERERKRIREYLYFAHDASYMGCKKPFIGFRIWTPITHLKDE